MNKVIQSLTKITEMALPFSLLSLLFHMVSKLLPLAKEKDMGARTPSNKKRLEIYV